MKISNPTFEQQQKHFHNELKRLAHPKKFGPLLDRSAAQIAVTRFQNKNIYVKSNSRYQLDLWEIENSKGVIYCFEDAHSDQIHSIVASSDHKFLISGSADHSIAMWSLEKNELVHRFNDAHSGIVTSIVISKDNKIAASAAFDKSIAIWDLAAKKLIHRFEMAHTDSIWDLAITSDGEFVVSVGEDHSIAVWNISKKRIYHRFDNAHYQTIYCVTVTPDDRYIATGSADGTIGIWDWKSKILTQKIENKDLAAVWCVMISGDLKKLIFGSEGGFMLTWDLSGENLGKELVRVSDPNFSENICILLPLPNSNNIVCASSTETVTVWDLSNKERPIQKFYKQYHWPYSLEVSHGGQYLLAADPTNMLVYNLVQRKLIHYLMTQDHPKAAGWAFTPDDKTLLTAHRTTIGIWEFPGLKFVERFDIPYDRDTLPDRVCVKVNNDLKIIYASSSDDHITVIDFKTKKVIQRFPDKFTSTIAVSKDHRYLVSGTDNFIISVWDLVEMKLVNQFIEPNKQSVQRVRISDDDVLISATWGGSINLWNYKDTKNSKPIKSFKVPNNDNRLEVLGNKMIWHDGDSYPRYLNYKELVVETKDQEVDGEIYSYQSGYYPWFSLQLIDNKNVVSVSDSGLQVWNMEATPTYVYEFNNPYFKVQGSFSITTNSKSIICSRRNNIEVWNIEKNVLEHRFQEVHHRPIISLALSKSGKYLISGCFESSLAIWNFENKELISKIERADSAAITSLRITDDDAIILSLSQKNVHIWNLSTRQKLHTFTKLDLDQVLFQAFAVDSTGRYLVTGNKDKSLSFYDIQAKTQIDHIANAHTGATLAVRFTPDGKRVISGSEDKSIAIWDLQTKKLLHRFNEVHQAEICSLAIDNEAKYLFSASKDKIGVIDLERLAVEYCDRSLNAELLQITPDGKYLVGLSGTTIGFLKLKEDLLTSKIKTDHTHQIECLITTKDNNFLITGSRDRTIIVYDLHLQRVFWHIQDAHNGPLYHFSLIENSKFFVSSGDDKTIAVWDLETKILFYRFDNIYISSIRSLANVPDTNIMVTGGGDKISVLDVLERKVISQIHNAHDRTHCVAVTNDGMHIASCSFDETVAVWEKKETDYVLKNRFKFPSPWKELWFVAITSDTQRAICSDRRKILVWKIGQIPDDPPEELNHAQSKSHDELFLSKDSRYLIASSREDKSLYIWNLHQKNCFYRLQHKNFESIGKVRFTDDLRHLLCVYDSTFIGITNTSFVTNDPELQRKKLPILHAIDCYLYPSRYNNKEVRECCRALTSFYYLPNGWDFLNFVAFMLPNIDAVLLDAAKENKITLGFDIYGKTQLEYLLEYEGKKDLQIQKFFTYFFKIISSFINLRVLDADKLLLALSRSIEPIFESQTEISFIHFLSCFSVKPEGNFHNHQMLPLQGELIGGEDDKAFAELSQLAYNKNELDGVVGDEGKETLSYTLISILLPHKIWSEDSLALIQMLNDSPNVFFYEASIVRNLTDFYWRNTRKYLWWWLIFHLIPVGLFTAFAIIRTDYYAIASGLLAGVMLINTFLLIFEILQFTSNFKEYIQDPFNFIETVIISVQFVTAGLFWGDVSDDALSFFVSLSTLLWYTKILVLLRINDQLRKLIRMIIEIISDSLSFMLVIFTYIVAFTIAMYQSRKASDTEDLNFWAVALEMYTFGIGSYDDTNYSGVTMPFFILATILMPLILLNMLIALMGDTYGRTNENAVSIDIKERIAMISEIASTIIQIRKLFSFVARKKTQAPLQRNYILVVEPYEENEENMTIESRIDGLKSVIEQKLDKILQILEQATLTRKKE